jgi:molybdate transport system substrate-binding protein
MRNNNSENTSLLNRRKFLTAAAGAATGAAIPNSLQAAPEFSRKSLQVWSCGGLAEAFMPANELFRKKTGVEVANTGAFAAALGKSLLGNAKTDVFAGRVLDLARRLREAEKMIFFKPLCFTRYVLVTPLGNPAGISDIRDLARPGVRIVLAPEASPPGGQAVTGILKQAGVVEQAMKNTVHRGTCVHRTMEELVAGKGDVSIVELRLTRLRLFEGKTDIIPIPEAFFPEGPLTFTIGRMIHAPDRKLADHYIDFICSQEGQSFFESAGFIPALSGEGERLIEKLGVKDA